MKREGSAMDLDSMAQAFVDDIDAGKDLDFTTEGEARLAELFKRHVAPLVATGDQMAEPYPELPSAEGMTSDAYSRALGEALRQRRDVTLRRAEAMRAWHKVHRETWTKDDWRDFYETLTAFKARFVVRHADTRR
jgi:shikimate kinase